MLVGYARVSTADQGLEVQEEALRAAKCERIFAEKRSGRNTEGRQELAAALEFVRDGDTLVITRIDRLARSLQDLQGIAGTLRGKGVALKATEQPVDTSTAAGKAFFQMLGVFAEFEANLRAERQREGVAKAKAEGKYKKGRPPKADPAVIRAALDAGEKPAHLAKRLGIGRTTVYRLAAAGPPA